MENRINQKSVNELFDLKSFFKKNPKYVKEIQDYIKYNKDRGTSVATKLYLFLNDSARNIPGYLKNAGRILNWKPTEYEAKHISKYLIELLKISNYNARGVKFDIDLAEYKLKHEFKDLFDDTVWRFMDVILAMKNTIFKKAGITDPIYYEIELVESYRLVETENGYWSIINQDGMKYRNAIFMDRRQALDEAEMCGIDLSNSMTTEDTYHSIFPTLESLQIRKGGLQMSVIVPFESITQKDIDYQVQNICLENGNEAIYVGNAKNDIDGVVEHNYKFEGYVSEKLIESLRSGIRGVCVDVSVVSKTLLEPRVVGY